MIKLNVFRTFAVTTSGNVCGINAASVEELNTRAFPGKWALKAFPVARQLESLFCQSSAESTSRSLSAVVAFFLIRTEFGMLL